MTDRPKGRAGRMVKVSERAPAFMQSGIELRGRVVHLGADKVAAVLGVAVADLAPLCAGRVKPSKSGMRRLRALARELEQCGEPSAAPTGDKRKKKDRGKTRGPTSNNPFSNGDAGQISLILVSRNAYPPQSVLRYAPQHERVGDMTLHPPARPASELPSKPAFIRAAIEISQHVARLGADRVAVMLGVAVVDLEPMLGGRVRPSEEGLRRLRRLERKLGH